MPRVSTVLGPTRLIAKIGGFCWPKHEVSWQGGKLLYRIDGLEAAMVPSAAERKTFWVVIDLLGYSDGKRITTTRTSWTGRSGRLISVTVGVACGALEATRTREGRISSTLCHSKDFYIGALLQQPFGR